MAAGDDPNDIAAGIERAINEVATDWTQWGNGTWREDTVCSVCGSALAGICGHQDDPEQRVILRRSYEAER